MNKFMTTIGAVVSLGILAVCGQVKGDSPRLLGLTHEWWALRTESRLSDEERTG